MSKKVITEALRPVELYQVDRLALRQKLDDALARVTRKLDKNIVAFGDKFPGEACETASGRVLKTSSGRPASGRASCGWRGK
ncbi:Uncharacterized protein conserved in bacteria [Raoultella planticola]|uniref:Uncharacterized protein conserved in bacteria n=1 Tax=Raoultella planticola TaxID=575 RepID=A0A485BZV5_RAOPL|nr:Uncharacterized protein conserved in bacteria [Raoultella planticola]